MITNSWETIAPMSTRRCTANSIVFGGKVYVFGGYYGAGRVREVERYNESLDVWELVQLNLKYPIEASLLFSLSDKEVLLLGGKDQYNQTSYATVYDLENCDIDQIQPMSSPHILSKGAKYMNRIVCFGGSTNNVFEYLDLPSNEWKKFPVIELTEARLFGRIAYAQGK